MTDSFNKGFRKVAFLNMATKLVQRAGKTLIHKAKNVGLKSSPATLGGIAMTGGFAGMEMAGVSQKVKSHMTSPATTMKAPSFSQRVIK